MTNRDWSKHQTVVCPNGSKIIVGCGSDPCRCAEKSEYVQVNSGEFHDLLVDDQTYRICGEARVFPGGLVWFAYPGDGMFVNLKDSLLHRKAVNGR